MSLIFKAWCFAFAGALTALLTRELAGLPHLLQNAMPGLLLGLLLGVAEAFAADHYRQKWASLFAGAIFGALGSVAGYYSGPLLTHAALYSHLARALIPQGRVSLHTIAETFPASLLGLIVGAGLGAARRSAVLARQYGLGGLLGGLAGSLMTAVFSLPSASLSLPDVFIGVGIGLLPVLLKPAWVRVQYNSRGGEEQILTRAVTAIGSAKSCDITLSGDPNVAPVHAVIEAMPGQKRHRVRSAAEGSFAPLTVNNISVIGDQWLADGDCLAIGSFTVSYHARSTRGAIRLGPARPQVWTQATGVWQMTEMISAYPAPGAAVPPSPFAENTPPETEQTPLLGLSTDSVPLRLVSDNQPHASLPGAILRGESGPYIGRAFWIGPEAAVTIGRALEREVSLAMDTSVSRLHARIIFDQGRHIVIDAGSANGTYVNGQRLLSPRTLQPGDLIGLGATSLRYG